MVFLKKTGVPEAWAGATLRQRLEYLGLCLAGWVVRQLPISLLVRLAPHLGNIVYFLDQRGRNVSLQNLQAAFGDTITLKEKKRIARKSHGSFARTMVELFWSPNLTPEFVKTHFLTEGLPGVPEGTPCIYVTTHSANFEWLGVNIPFHMKPGFVVAQKLKNPLLGSYFDALRGCSGHTIFAQERAISKMLAHLKSGGYFCALVDLNLDPSEASVIIEQFGGLKTCVTKIHAALATHTNAKIIPAECIPLPDGKYRMRYFPCLEYDKNATAAEIVQQCWDVLEPGIRLRPECWLWSYKHWRFRPSDHSRDRYPPYSNFAKRFDAAIKKQSARER
jgi:lauroyl/myristoyl acyltransferase